jgi:hypothetical protein
MLLTHALMNIMSLKKQLQSIVNQYVEEIEHIRDFVSSVKRSLDKKQQRKPKQALSVEDRKQLLQLIGAIAKGADIKTDIKLSNNAGNFIMQVTLLQMQSLLLSEMTLAYLVSYQEAFIKDYIFEILIDKKEMLRSSATLTYKQIVSFSSLEALIREMARREVDSLGYGSIDDVADYFNKRLSVSLRKYKKWHQLREINYRRNIVIHNRGRTNHIYCEKTGFAECDKQLNTNYAYVSSAAAVTIDFVNYLNDEIVKHFKLT